MSWMFKTSINSILEGDDYIEDVAGVDRGLLFLNKLLMCPKCRHELKLKKVNEVKNSDDIEGIKKVVEDLTQAFYAVSSKMYQAEAGAQGGAGFDPNNMGGAAGGAQHDDNVVDADFKVDDDK
jgi:uncharacterized protein YbaR (Trm112 family)